MIVDPVTLDLPNNVKIYTNRHTLGYLLSMCPLGKKVIARTHAVLLLRFLSNTQDR